MTQRLSLYLALIIFSVVPATGFETAPAQLTQVQSLSHWIVTQQRPKKPHQTHRRRQHQFIHVH